MEVNIDLIRPSPYQPRLTFNVEDLKQEIQRDGLLNPLLVRKLDRFYELIDGERRLRVLKELGWKTVPVEVRELDERRARLSIWKLNTVRETYSIEERARYFKKLADGGITAYQIGMELSVDDNWVRAHLNTFRFPEEVQKAVWTGELALATIRELEPIINANIQEAIKIARETLLRRLPSDEVRKLVTSRYGTEIEEARLKAAQEALGAAAPISVKLEEPRELQKAAKALLEEAKRKQEEALTPEEKARLARKREEKRHRAEKARKALEEKIRVKVEQEVSREAVEELVKKPAVIKELVRRPEVRQALEVETLREPKEELSVREQIAYTIGELDCDRCGKHYVIKCDGKRNWLE